MCAIGTHLRIASKYFVRTDMNDSFQNTTPSSAHGT
ncbi:MAG: hypothetical protein JWN98_1205, partial [Abditibacteriota bacterium]|nr:hypothetical protein [Abditibacteriota bacterium]